MDEMVILERRSNTKGISPENTDHGTKTEFLKNFIEKGDFPKIMVLPK